MSDIAVLPLLLQAMEAAGFHDAQGCEKALVEAGQSHHLGGGFHKARIDIHDARRAAAAGDFPAVWSHCWVASTQLTYTLPPDPGVCPPRPQETPFSREGTTCSCGQTSGSHARFCPACGAALG